MENDILKTTVLPKFNCSNCQYYCRKKELIKTKSLVKGNPYYAIECTNVVHPLEDCVLRGFEAHSEQPGFSQTLNK